MSNQLDVATLSPGSQVTIKPPESEAEHQARLERERADGELKRELEREDARLKRFMKKWTFLGGGLLVGALGVASFYFAVHSSGELQKWAMSTVSLIAGALVGFISGRASARSGDG
jgi:hypothetical protein